MASFLLLSFLIALASTANADGHEIIFIVDNSETVANEVCAEQQAGIAHYFEELHDLTVDNKLAYLSFNGDPIKTLIGFDDKEDLAAKIQNDECNQDQSNTDAVQTKLDAITYAISMFNDNELTPRIILFNNFGTKNDENAVCRHFYNNYNDAYGNLIEITVVNIFGNNVYKNYLKCLTQQETSRYFEFADSSSDTFDTYQNDIISAIVGSDESGDTPEEFEALKMDYDGSGSIQINQTSNTLWTLVGCIAVILVIGLILMFSRCMKINDSGNRKSSAMPNYSSMEKKYTI